MGWKTALDDYITYLRLERGLSENSIQSYAYDIKAFILYINDFPLNSHSKNVVKKMPKLMCIILQSR